MNYCKAEAAQFDFWEYLFPVCLSWLLPASSGGIEEGEGGDSTLWFSHLSTADSVSVSNQLILMIII